ncbi:hypothetical protein Tco_1194884 [Tanacetum coccineum]
MPNDVRDVNISSIKTNALSLHLLCGNERHEDPENQIPRCCGVDLELDLRRVSLPVSPRWFVSFQLENRALKLSFGMRAMNDRLDTKLLEAEIPPEESWELRRSRCETVLFMEEKSFDLPTQSYRGRVPQQLIFKTIAGDVEIWLIVFGLPLRTETNDEAPLAEGLETDLTVGLGATFGREELIGGRS